MFLICSHNAIMLMYSLIYLSLCDSLAQTGTFLLLRIYPNEGVRCEDICVSVYTHEPCLPITKAHYLLKDYLSHSGLWHAAQLIQLCLFSIWKYCPGSDAHPWCRKPKEAVEILKHGICVFLFILYPTNHLPSSDRPVKHLTRLTGVFWLTAYGSLDK